MSRFTFLAFFVVATSAPSLHTAEGQAINANVQTAAPRVAARPVARARVAPQVVSRPTGLRFHQNLPRTIVQPAMNPQRNYFPSVQSANPAFAALNLQPSTTRTIAVDPSTRQTELQTPAAMHPRRGIVTRQGEILDSVTRQSETQTMPERHVVGPNNQTVATTNPQRQGTNRDPEIGPQQDKAEPPKESQGKKWHHKKDVGFDEAFRRHWHEWHDRNWWHDHCNTIVVVTTGYYFLDGSYWYPAWGYDPLQSSYDYDGPVYTYGNLLPDEVIANVQTVLQDAGYYYGEITGSLGVDTRAAIANFQRDNNLQITGAIDEGTVEALGLY